MPYCVVCFCFISRLFSNRILQNHGCSHEFLKSHANFSLNLTGFTLKAELNHLKSNRVINHSRFDCFNIFQYAEWLCQVLEVVVYIKSLGVSFPPWHQKALSFLKYFCDCLPYFYNLSLTTLKYLLFISSQIDLIAKLCCWQAEQFNHVIITLDSIWPQMIKVLHSKLSIAMKTQLRKCWNRGFLV